MRVKVLLTLLVVSAPSSPWRSWRGAHLVSGPGGADLRCRVRRLPRRQPAKKGLDLSPGKGYATLVDRPPTRSGVAPGQGRRSGASYLWQKLTHTASEGKGMPRTIFSAKKLPDEQLDLVKRWIEEGASPDSGPGRRGSASRRPHRPGSALSPPLPSARQLLPGPSRLLWSPQRPSKTRTIPSGESTSPVGVRSARMALIRSRARREDSTRETMAATRRGCPSSHSPTRHDRNSRA